MIPEAEINRVLAERAMGWKLTDPTGNEPLYNAGYYKDGELMIKYKDWNPLHNISQAIMCAEINHFDCGKSADIFWCRNHEYHRFIGKTLAEAISIACYEAVKGDKNDA